MDDTYGHIAELDQRHTDVLTRYYSAFSGIPRRAREELLIKLNERRFMRQLEFVGTYLRGLPGIFPKLSPKQKEDGTALGLSAVLDLERSLAKAVEEVKQKHAV